MMARKPAFAGGVGLRQRVWEMIRATSGRDFERLEVMPVDADVDSVRSYLAGLEKAGYIERAGERAGAHDGARVRRYRLVRDVGAEAPRVTKSGRPVTQGLKVERLWRALRMLKEATALELAAHASLGDQLVKESYAADWLANLERSGHVRVERAARAGHGGVPARYRLVRDSGPRPPMVCRARVLFDPNTGEVWPLAAVTEEDADARA